VLSFKNTKTISCHSTRLKPSEGHCIQAKTRSLGNARKRLHRDEDEQWFLKRLLWLEGQVDSIQAARYVLWTSRPLTL
jgi:hypothetical protein